MSVKGLKEMSARLNQELKSIKTKTDAGLFAAGNIVIARSKELTPVDHGNLRANQDAELEKSGLVSLNVRSNYALYVHENVEEKWRGLPRKSGSRGNYWDGGRSRFLETAMDETRGEVIDTIKEFTEIKS